MNLHIIQIIIPSHYCFLNGDILLNDYCKNIVLNSLWHWATVCIPVSPSLFVWGWFLDDYKYSSWIDESTSDIHIQLLIFGVCPWYHLPFVLICFIVPYVEAYNFFYYVKKVLEAILTNVRQETLGQRISIKNLWRHSDSNL